MPPLRDREEDIPLLVRTILKNAAKENEKPVREITSDAMAALCDYRWPGNVRELESVMTRAVVLANGPKVTLRELPLQVRENRATHSVSRVPQPEPGQHLDLHSTEHRLIMKALEETRGNRTLAAQRLGISRRTLHRKLKEFPHLDSGAA